MEVVKDSAAQLPCRSAAHRLAFAKVVPGLVALNHLQANPGSGALAPYSISVSSALFDYPLNEQHPPGDEREN